MKTTDLIPILLYHLKDSDKYGLELINACSDCSDGKITVKQPTLYSVLKKLEKSKFISSYWQDSDIGGKRHYFKITDNGLSQLETYPPLEDLVKMVTTEEASVISEPEEEIENETKIVSSPSPFDNFSIKKAEDTSENKINVFDKLFKNNEEKNEEQVNSEENIESTTEVSEDIAGNKYNDEIVEEIAENIDEMPEDTQDIINEENVGSANAITSNSTSDVKEETQSYAETSSFNVFDALDFGNSDDENEEKAEVLTSPNSNFKLENPFFKEVKEKSLEEKTSLEINEENTKLLSKDEKTNEFVSNKNVAKFTEKNIVPTETVKKEVANLFTQEVRSATPMKYETEEQIRHQDYVDIKNDINVKKTVKTANKRLYKVLTSSIFSLIVILSCFFVVLQSGFSAMFTVFSISSALYVVYYACNFVGKFKEHRFVIGEKFSYNFKKKFLIRACLFVALILFILIYNLVQKNSLFIFSNFANFLAPIVISSLLIIDYIFALIFYKKL